MVMDTATIVFLALFAVIVVLAFPPSAGGAQAPTCTTSRSGASAGGRSATG
jgi:hypothetical protein